MSFSPEEKTRVLTDIELMKADHEMTKDVVKELRDQHKGTLESLNNVSEKISNLVTVIEVKTANDEHLKSEVNVNKAEIKEVKINLEKFKDWSGPILRSSQRTQSLRYKVWQSMASKTGVIIMTLSSAIVVYAYNYFFK